MLGIQKAPSENVSSYSEQSSFWFQSLNSRQLLVHCEAEISIQSELAVCLPDSGEGETGHTARNVRFTSLSSNANRTSCAHSEAALPRTELSGKKKKNTHEAWSEKSQVCELNFHQIPVSLYSLFVDLCGLLCLWFCAKPSEYVFEDLLEFSERFGVLQHVWLKFMTGPHLH